MRRTPVFLALALVLHTPSSTLAEYSDAIARDAALFSAAAYCPPSTVKDWSVLPDCAARSSGFSVNATYKVTPTWTASDAFAILGVDSEREWIVASFKGTNSTDDWLTDFFGGNFPFASCEINGNELGHLHAGFCHYYRDIAKMGFTEGLVRLAATHPTYQVMLTGHSLGAAAAVIAARDFYHSSGGQRATVYTFGQPRVGDYDASVAFTAETSEAYRVVHACDIVAHVPICCAIPLVGACSQASRCPYHTASERWYDNDMSEGSSWKECDGPEDQSCSCYMDTSVDDHIWYFNENIWGYCCFDSAMA